MLGALSLGACVGSEGVDAAPEAEVAAAEEAFELLQAVPAELAVPSGNYLAAYRKGIGAQIYVCTAADAGYSWVFKAPEADLFFPGKHLAGSHYAGPTWEALDGSTVVGMKLASATVDASAIPWLLLQAASHSGNGVFSKVAYIQRLNTTAGLAPTASCDAANVGQAVDVDYTAGYFFYDPLPKRPHSK
jgi:hypothetical protein